MTNHILKMIDTGVGGNRDWGALISNASSQQNATYAFQDK